VPTRALALVVREWTREWDRDHPDLAGRSRDENGALLGGGGSETSRNALGQLSGNSTVGALTILHERTRQNDPLGRGVTKRRLHDMLSPRAGRYTELATADLIVSAIGRPDLWHDGSLPVEPNPSASRRARADCCGGSQTASTAPNSLVGVVAPAA
jgi:hypothetical protein